MKSVAGPSVKLCKQPFETNPRGFGADFVLS
jgi:hypothetical protein